MKTVFHQDGDDVVVERIQDVEPVLKRAAQLRHAGAGRSDSGDLHHVASLPRVMVENYCNRHGITLREWLVDPVHVERMLADRDLSGFRVYEGKRYV